MELSDGSILSSNLELQGGDNDNLAEMYSTNTLYVGQVIRTLFIDSPQNRSKRFVEYDVLVNEKGITSSVFKNCRAVNGGGDQNNFNERVLQQTTEGKYGKKDDSEPYIFKDGAVVVVGFIDGNKESPVILGTLQHPNIHIDKEVNNTPEFVQVGSTTSRDANLTKLPTILPGAKENGDNDGQRILGEFQGLRWNINKDGELTIIYQGPKDAKGNLKASDTQPTILKINKDGELFLIDNLDQEIKISRVDKSIRISSGNDPADFIEISRADQTITHEMSKDEVHNIGRDREVNVEVDEAETVKGKSTTDINGDKENTVGGDKIQQIKGRHLEKISGTWRVKVGGEIVFSYPTMKLGSDGASEPVMLGTTYDAYNTSVIVARINALIAVVNTLGGTMDSHTHPYTWTDPAGSGNTGVSGSSSPAGPAVATPAPAAAFSTKTKAE